MKINLHNILKIALQGTRERGAGEKGNAFQFARQISNIVERELGIELAVPREGIPGREHRVQISTLGHVQDVFIRFTRAEAGELIRGPLAVVDNLAVDQEGEFTGGWSGELPKGTDRVLVDVPTAGFEIPYAESRTSAPELEVIQVWIEAWWGPGIGTQQRAELQWKGVVDEIIRDLTPWVRYPRHAAWIDPVNEGTTSYQTRIAPPDLESQEAQEVDRDRFEAGIVLSIIYDIRPD